jgi:DNA polymerase elongation subunit (family B)
MYKSRSLTKGRLLVDTFLMAKEYMKATDYKIQTIATELFKTEHKEIDKNRILEILET